MTRPAPGSPLDPLSACSAPAPGSLCIGAAHWDVIGHCASRAERGADLPGRVERRPGGVALNIAFALASLGLRPALLAAVGSDPEGGALAESVQAAGIDSRFLLRCDGCTTDLYLALEDPDGLRAAVADARLVEACGSELLAPLRNGQLGSATQPWSGLVVLDGNLAASVLEELAGDAALARADLRLTAASPAKVARLRPLLGHPRLTLYLNRAEAEVLAGRRFPTAEAAARDLLSLGVRRVLVTDGPRPVALATAQEGRAGLLTAAPPALRALRVTGAGDRLLAAHVAAEAGGADSATALARAVAAAVRHVSAAAPVHHPAPHS